MAVVFRQVPVPWIVAERLEIACSQSVFRSGGCRKTGTDGQGGLPP